MIRLLTVAATFFVIGSTVVHAQDKKCDSLKDPKYRKSCNCYVSNGGWTEDLPNGRIRWSVRGGGSNMALQACLAKIQ